MSFKSKLLLVLVMLTLVADCALAAWLDTSALPVPPYAEEVKKDSRRIAGQEFSFTYYTSTQDTATIKDFYRSRLPNLGWKEKTPLKDLVQIPNFKLEPSLSNVFEQNLMFEKDGSTLIINFMPQGVFKDGKTRFSVSKGKLDIKAGLPKDTDFTPELLTKPQKEVAPIYPGASLITLSEQPHLSQATYFSKDDMETIIEFYKTRMPRYAWYLVEEKPVEKIDSGDYDLSEHCPDCPKDIQPTVKSMQTELAQLDFSNQQGDACKIVLFRAISKEAVDVPLSDMTTILVHYAEKKK